mmetsp:Transcript_129458/g.224840  ORF Transcript_129458/g.224840 Transcript_129458/m.224840 type:complete len:957 (-) Transcript_129458:60-2930(-)
MLSATGSAVETVFDYNRKNFLNDRTMRQKMEYQMLDMRIDQATMWREDVRNFMELTLNKLENYLLVAALELGFCVVAFCKGRVPPGCPPWLAACHTLTLTGAFMYLFMSVWLGMHGYVAAQAYKVRVLTHFVRLPVPEWRELEAARTYGSQFEKMNPSQILRIPFAMGSQENRVPDTPAIANGKSAARSPRRPLSPAPGGASGTASSAAEAQGAPADPWGLERQANFVENAPDVNEQTASQRHIWLAREAAKYYETYDAFCRVSMSAGTVALATFFCYYCLSYVLTENASPIGAAAGVCSFAGVALVLLRLDMKLTGTNYIISCVLHAVPPMLGFGVAFINSKYKGHGFRSESLMPMVFFIHALNTWFYIYIFRVREMESGALLPAAFGPVLYLDAFGWARHRASAERRVRSTHAPATAPGGAATLSTAVEGVRRQSLRRMSSTANEDRQNFGRRNSTLLRAQSFRTSVSRASIGSMPPRQEEATAESSAQALSQAESQLPAMAMTSSTAPSRPEDQGAGNTSHARAAPSQAAVSFRPSTFAMSLVERDEEVANEQDIVTGGDNLGERPGVLPWRAFLLSTILYGSLFFLSGIIAIVCQIEGSNFYLARTPGHYGIRDGMVAPLPLLTGEQISVTWPGPMLRPQGLATDPHGMVFAATGVDTEGRKSVFHSMVQIANVKSLMQGPPRGKKRHQMNFSVLESCGDELQDVHEPLQDIVLHGCAEQGGCAALVLPRRGNRLISCEGVSFPNTTKQQQNWTRMHRRVKKALPITKEWLDDRGASSIENPAQLSDDYPEELASIALVPCTASGGAGPRGSSREDCLVVGTTSRRVVQMGVHNVRKKGDIWVPRRVMCEDHREVPGPGTFSLLGGRYLGVLQRNTSSLRVIDLWRAGAHAGTWRMPEAHKGRRYAALASSDSHFYAMEEGEDPSIWKIGVPLELSSTGTPATGLHKRKVKI